MGEPARENKMGVMPINRLLLNMALPMIASMLVQALYNVVDSVFVAKLSEDALNAVSLAFPVQSLMIAVSVGTGVGINALLSRSLGQKDQERANKTAMNGMLLGAISCLVFTVLGLTCARLFYAVQTDITTIVDYGADYLSICCGVSVGLFLSVTCERLLQATGRTFYTMITQGTGAIINIILDPILIFGLFGFPRMEVAGAAVATVTGQIVAAVAAIILNQKKNHEVKINMKGFRPSVEVIAQIYEIGIPSIVMQAISSVMTYGMNLILISFSATATAVFGIYFKLQSFIFMPVFGLNNGVIPIVAYNYGAQKRDRVLSAIRHVITYAVVIMILGLVIFQTIPDKLLMMFSASETMLAIGVPALRTISLSFLLAGFCIAAGSVFQALGKSIYSMYVSVARQLVVLLPVAYALSRLGRVELVWWAIPIAELMSLAMTVICMIHINKNIISKIGKNS